MELEGVYNIFLYIHVLNAYMYLRLIAMPKHVRFQPHNVDHTSLDSENLSAKSGLWDDRAFPHQDPSHSKQSKSRMEPRDHSSLPPLDNLLDSLPQDTFSERQTSEGDSTHIDSHIEASE